MDINLYSDFKNYFSAWIFIFFVLYYFNVSYFNPIILLVTSTIFVLFGSIYVYLETKDILHTLKFSYLSIFIKLIPIYLIIHKPIYYHDIVITTIMCILYYVYVTYYGKFDLIEFYTHMPETFLKSIIELFAVKK